MNGGIKIEKKKTSLEDKKIKSEIMYNFCWVLVGLVLICSVLWVVKEETSEPDYKRLAVSICQGKGYYSGYYFENGDSVCCRMFMNQTEFNNPDEQTCFPTSI